MREREDEFLRLCEHFLTTLLNTYQVTINWENQLGKLSEAFVVESFNYKF